METTYWPPQTGLIPGSLVMLQGLLYQMTIISPATLWLLMRTRTSGLSSRWARLFLFLGQTPDLIFSVRRLKRKLMRTKSLENRSFWTKRSQDLVGHELCQSRKARITTRIRKANLCICSMTANSFRRQLILGHQSTQKQGYKRAQKPTSRQLPSRRQPKGYRRIQPSVGWIGPCKCRSRV